MAQDRGETYQPAEEKKERSQEEIDLERQSIEKKFRVKYQETIENEKLILSKTVNRLYSSSNKNLGVLGDKVLLYSSQICDLKPSLTVQNKEIEAVLMN